MFKKNERETSHSSDSPRHPQVSFSSITDSPSCSFSNTYDVELFYRDKGSESDHITCSNDRQYVPKNFERNPLAEFSKESINVTYIHEIKMSCDQVKSYNFDNKNETVTTKSGKNGTNSIAPASGHHNLSSSSFKTFLKSISPSGKRKHELKKEAAAKSPRKVSERRLNQSESDEEKLKNKDKKVTIKKEFSFKSFSK